MRKVSLNLPSMSLIGNYLAKALELKASDIHFCEGEPVKVRVDGYIQTLDEALPQMKELFDEIYDLCDESVRERSKAEFAKLHDVSISFPTPYKIRIRATLYRDEKGLCVAMRLIPQNPPDPKTIGIPESIMDVCSRNRGLFIVTGATGSGKSTTLSCMIDFINKNKRGRIITLEDPIEYIIPSDKCIVNHREIGRHIESFASGLKSTLREDPNVVVIGELRDLESMRAAMQIAETGHLVLTTLHTRNTPATIDRLIGAFPPDDQPQIRMMLADNLIGVLAQTLIPRIGGGRAAAFEYLLNNDAIKNNIREAKIYQIDNVLQTGARQGMICMEDYIVHLVKYKIVDPNVALEFAPSRQKLMLKYKSLLGI